MGGGCTEFQNIRITTACARHVDPIDRPEFLPCVDEIFINKLKFPLFFFRKKISPKVIVFIRQIILLLSNEETQ